MEVLRSKQANKLLDQFDDPPADLMPINKYTDHGPDAAAIKQTPGPYVPSVPAPQAADFPSSQLKGQTAANQTSADGPAAANGPQQDTDMTDVVPVKKPAPVTPEQQVLNAALKELAKLLTGALPISKRLRLASAHGKITEAVELLFSLSEFANEIVLLPVEQVDKRA